MELLDFIEAYYSPARKKAAESLASATSATSAPDLDLPVWDSRDTKRTPVSPEALIRRSEGFLAYYNGQPNAAK